LYPIGGYNVAAEFKTATLEASEQDGSGQIKAVFSTFDVIDADGDILRKSAFTEQPIPLCWSHDWSRPIGKGHIRVEPTRAVFDGSFFMNTVDGANAYEICKAMSDLQEFSYGFRVVESKQIKHEGRAAREITKIDVFEVSAVLKGASVGTHILAIKGNERMDEEEGRVLADLADYMARVKSLADLRAKEGRALSTQRRTRLEQMRDVLSNGLEELNRLLEETTPRSADDESESDGAKQIRQIELDHLALSARALGVDV
jgi:HK97 family phage prohead protease